MADLKTVSAILGDIERDLNQFRAETMERFQALQWRFGRTLQPI